MWNDSVWLGREKAGNGGKSLVGGLGDGCR